tara:strand:- start:769 stop:915 length:147 start_codon:yes stop_codon:yes gene_type:complete
VLAGREEARQRTVVVGNDGVLGTVKRNQRDGKTKMREMRSKKNEAASD